MSYFRLNENATVITDPRDWLMQIINEDLEPRYLDIMRAELRARAEADDDEVENMSADAYCVYTLRYIRRGDRQHFSQRYNTREGLIKGVRFAIECDAAEEIKVIIKPEDFYLDNQ